MNKQDANELFSVQCLQDKFIQYFCFFNIGLKKSQCLYHPFVRMFRLIILMVFFSSTALAAQIQLAWDSNTESDLVGYRVFSHKSGDSYDYSSPTWSGPENRCTIENLDEESAYYFVVRAFNSSGAESGDSNEVYYSTAQSQNNPPAANAGSDRIIAEGDPVVLDGSGSADGDGTIVTYHWHQTAGPSVTLSDPAVVKPGFVAPQVSSSGTILTFQLTVTDNGGLTDSDTVSIRVNDLVSADSDGDGAANEQDAFPDDPDEWIDSDNDGIGNNSDTDDDNDQMPDTWEIEYGLDPLNDDAGQDADSDGFSNIMEYQYQTSPTDENSSPPQTPVAKAGFDQTVTEGSTVTLDGSASYDPNGGSCVYQWSQTGGPQIVLSDETAAVPTFVPGPVSDNDMVLTFNLMVTDEDGFEDNDRIDVLVRDNGITGFPADAVTFYSIDDQPLAVQVHDGGHLVRLEAVDPDFTDDTGDRPRVLPYGLIDMNVRALNPGGSVVLTVYLPEGASEDTTWYNYSDASGWQDYSTNIDFNETRDQVTIVLTDGGAGDNDRQVNSMILDPSGLGSISREPAADPVESTTTSGGGGGGCFIGAAGTESASIPGYPTCRVLTAVAAVFASVGFLLFGAWSRFIKSDF